MPALRKPTTILEANGAFERNPARTRTNEPKASGIGPAPAYLDEQEQGIWDEIVRNCAAGVFQSSDRVLLEGICRLIRTWRTDPYHFGTKSMTLLLSMLARCGMTPSDRSRVSVPPSDPKDKPKTGLASFRR